MPPAYPVPPRPPEPPVAADGTHAPPVKQSPLWHLTPSQGEARLPPEVVVPHLAARLPELPTRSSQDTSLFMDDGRFMVTTPDTARKRIMIRCLMDSHGRVDETIDRYRVETGCDAATAEKELRELGIAHRRHTEDKSEVDALAAALLELNMRALQTAAETLDFKATSAHPGAAEAAAKIRLRAADAVHKGTERIIDTFIAPTDGRYQKNTRLDVRMVNADNYKDEQLVLELLGPGAPTPRFEAPK